MQSLALLGGKLPAKGRLQVRSRESPEPRGAPQCTACPPRRACARRQRDGALSPPATCAGLTRLCWASMRAWPPPSSAARRFSSMRWGTGGGRAPEAARPRHSPTARRSTRTAAMSRRCACAPAQAPSPAPLRRPGGPTMAEWSGAHGSGAHGSGTPGRAAASTGPGAGRCLSPALLGRVVHRCCLCAETSRKMHQLFPLSCVAERFVTLQKWGRQAEVSARKISCPFFVPNARKYLLGKQSLWHTGTAASYEKALWLLSRHTLGRRQMETP